MEYRELYDENRQPLGIAITKSDPVPPNAYMLTVGIWIVNDQKQILLTRRSFEKRYAPGMWENPAGHVQKGETCEDAIIRELREETGMLAANWVHLTDLVTAPGFCDEVISIYLATGLTAGEDEPDEDEFLNVVKLPFEEAYAMVLRGEIRDAKTQVVLCMAKAIL